MTASTILSTPTTSTGLVPLVQSSISSSSNNSNTDTNNNNNSTNQDEIQLYNELKEFLHCSNRIDIKLVATDAVYQQITSVSSTTSNDNCYKIIQFNLLPIIIKNCSYEYIDDNANNKKDAIANMMVSVTSLKILVYMSSNTLYSNQIIHDLLQVVPGFGFGSSSGGMNRFIEIVLSKPPKCLNSTVKDVDTITIIKLWKQQINYSMSLLANITRIEEGAVEMAGKTLQDNAIHNNKSAPIKITPIDNDNEDEDNTNNNQMLSLDDVNYNDHPEPEHDKDTTIETTTPVGTLEAKPTLDLLLARFLNETFINMDIDYNNMIQLEQEYYKNKHPKKGQQQEKRLPSTTTLDNIDDIDEEVESDNDDNDSDIDDDYDLKYGTKLHSTTSNNNSTIRSTETVIDDKKDDTTASTTTIVDENNNNNNNCDNNNNTQSSITKKNIPILLDSFHEDPYQHYASILMNLTQIEQGRQFVLKIHRRTTTNNKITTAKNSNNAKENVKEEEEEWTVLQKLIGQLKTSINPIRRRGIAGMIKNCLLDSNYSYWFINVVQITNYILYPLAGSEELDIDEKQGLDIDLWMYCYNKIREVDNMTRQLLVECIVCLCQHGRTAREQLRLRRVYIILKYTDMVEENETINELIYECVNYLRGDEAGTDEGSSDQFVANAYNKVHNPTTIKAQTTTTNSTDLLLLKDKENNNVDEIDTNGIMESSLIDDNNNNYDNVEEDFDDVD